jgi:RHS repeat-associated protein
LLVLRTALALALTLATAASSANYSTATEALRPKTRVRGSQEIFDVRTGVRVASTRDGVGEKTRFEYEVASAPTVLTYFGARYYDSRHARWISTDPARPDVGWAAMGKARPIAPWTLSLYGYARSNPIALLDPDGLDPLTPEQKVKVETALAKIRSVPSYVPSAAQMEALNKAGKIEQAGTLQRALKALAPNKDPAAVTDASGVTYIYDFEAWTGLDATLVHESSHQLDLQEGLDKFHEDPDVETDPTSRAYNVEKDYIDARNAARAEAAQKQSPQKSAPKQSIAPQPVSRDPGTQANPGAASKPNQQLKTKDAE